MNWRSGVLSLTLLLLSTAASAQDRAEEWDFSFSLTDTSSEFLTGENGSTLSIDGDLGWGFNFNYNVSNRFAIGGEIGWAGPDYVAERVIDGTGLVDRVSAELDLATVQFKGTFYLTEGAVAPFIEGGAGWTRVDSNIVDGPPTTGCWWDPWWGYICTSFYDTYSETQTSYSYAVGLRWDVSPDVMLRATYGLFEIDSGRSEDGEFDTIRIDIGYRF